MMAGCNGAVSSSLRGFPGPSWFAYPFGTRRVRLTGEPYSSARGRASRRRWSERDKASSAPLSDFSPSRQPCRSPCHSLVCNSVWSRASGSWSDWAVWPARTSWPARSSTPRSCWTSSGRLWAAVSTVRRRPARSFRASRRRLLGWKSRPCRSVRLKIRGRRLVDSIYRNAAHALALVDVTVGKIRVGRWARRRYSISISYSGRR